MKDLKKAPTIWSALSGKPGTQEQPLPLLPFRPGGVGGVPAARSPSRAVFMTRRGASVKTVRSGRVPGALVGRTRGGLFCLVQGVARCGRRAYCAMII